jgi:hypothetical protein
MSNHRDFLLTIYNKRFCQPSATNGTSETAQLVTNEKTFGNYNHVSCIFEGKISNLCNEGKKVRIHSYGMNHFNGPHDIVPSVHAEHDAMMKLKPLPRKNNKRKCSIFVTRLSKTGKMGTSKPCWMCISNMCYIPEQRGYRIHHVYYTDQYENIVHTTLNRLLQESEKYYTSGYRTIGYTLHENT